jgi:hypothetical protein
VGGAWCDAGSPLSAPPDAWQADVAIDWGDAAVRLAKTLPAGDWRLLVPRPGSAPFVSDPVRVGAADEARAVVVLPDPAAGRRVRIVDALDGHPLPGARLRPWFAVVKDFAYLPGCEVAAGADGTAELPLPATPASGAAAAPQVTWSVESGTHAGEFDGGLLTARRDEVPLLIRVFPSVRIEGEAFSAPGVPATGRVVSFTSKGRVVRGVCDAAGSFRLEGVAVRKAAAEAVPLCLWTAEQSRFYAVQVEAGGTIRVSLGPREGGAPVGSVRGTLTSGGRPLAGLQVALVPLAEPRTLRYAATRADGSYSFDAVPAGPARLRIVCGDPRVSDAARVESKGPFDVGPGETVKFDFDLPGAAFRVLVCDATSGRPVAGARVTARPAGPGDAAPTFPGSVFVPGWSAFTGADGAAFLPGMLPVVPHRVEVTDAAGRTGRADAAVAGTTAAPADVRIELGR